MQVLGLGSLAAVFWLLFFECFRFSPHVAGLHTPELGPLQSCLTGPQAALLVGRCPLALGFQLFQWKLHTPRPAYGIS